MNRPEDVERAGHDDSAASDNSAASKNSATTNDPYDAFDTLDSYDEADHAEPMVDPIAHPILDPIAHPVMDDMADPDAFVAGPFRPPVARTPDPVSAPMSAPDFSSTPDQPVDEPDTATDDAAVDSGLGQSTSDDVPSHGSIAGSAVDAGHDEDDDIEPTIAVDLHAHDAFAWPESPFARSKAPATTNGAGPVPATTDGPENPSTRTAELESTGADSTVQVSAGVGGGESDAANPDQWAQGLFATNDEDTAAAPSAVETASASHALVDSDQETEGVAAVEEERSFFIERPSDRAADDRADGSDERSNGATVGENHDDDATGAADDGGFDSADDLARSSADERDEDRAGDPKQGVVGGEDSGESADEADSRVSASEWTIRRGAGYGDSDESADARARKAVSFGDPATASLAEHEEQESAPVVAEVTDDEANSGYHTPGFQPETVDAAETAGAEADEADTGRRSVNLFRADDIPAFFARDSRDSRDSRDTGDNRDARSLRDARGHRDARDARDVTATRDAGESRETGDGRGGRDAHDEGDELVEHDGQDEAEDYGDEVEPVRRDRTDEFSVRPAYPLHGVIAGGAGLLALLFAIAAARDSGFGALWRWVFALGFASLAVLAIRALVSKPMLVADRTGIRLRITREWIGAPWEEIEAVTVLPRRHLLDDGRIAIHLSDPGPVVAAIARDSNRATRNLTDTNRRLTGSSLAVPFGLAATPSDSAVVTALTTLADDRCAVTVQP